MQLEGEGRYFKAVPGRSSYALDKVSKGQKRRLDVELRQLQIESDTSFARSSPRRSTRKCHTKHDTGNRVPLTNEGWSHCEQTSETGNTNFCRLWTEAWMRCERICPACNSCTESGSTSTTIPQWSSPVSSGEQTLRCSIQRH